MWLIWLGIGAAGGASAAVAVPRVYATVRKLLDDFKAHFSG